MFVHKEPPGLLTMNEWKTWRVGGHHSGWLGAEEHSDSHLPKESKNIYLLVKHSYFPSCLKAIFTCIFFFYWGITDEYNGTIFEAHAMPWCDTRIHSKRISTAKLTTYPSPHIFTSLLFQLPFLKRNGTHISQEENVYIKEVQSINIYTYLCIESLQRIHGKLKEWWPLA